MGTFSKAFVVVDALDECTDRTRAELLIALRSLGSNVSMLVTSRNLASIAQEFHETKHLDIRASDKDVEKYIEGRIPLEPSLQTHVDNDPSLREEIVEKITENIQGMSVSHLSHSFDRSLTFLKVFTSSTPHGPADERDQRSGGSEYSSKFTKRHDRDL